MDIKDLIKKYIDNLNITRFVIKTEDGKHKEVEFKMNLEANEDICVISDTQPGCKEGSYISVNSTEQKYTLDKIPDDVLEPLLVRLGEENIKREKMIKEHPEIKVTDYAILLPEIEVDDVLEEPFRTAFINKASIDYKVDPKSKNNDHKYVKEELGLECKMAGDCTYYAPGLRGFSLSSYGDWGTFYADDATWAEKKIFLDMIKKKCITPWRTRVYVHEKNGEVLSCDYDAEENTWKKWTNEQWSEVESPFINKQKTTNNNI